MSFDHQITYPFYYPILQFTYQFSVLFYLHSSPNYFSSFESNEALINTNYMASFSFSAKGCLLWLMNCHLISIIEVAQRSNLGVAQHRKSN